MPLGIRMVLTSLASSLALVWSAEARDAIEVDEMKRFCHDRAAEKFHIRPRDILTLPLERSDDGYTVFGQYPPEGRRVTTFECHYGRDGKWRRIRTTGDDEASRSERDNREKVVERSAMSAYCAGEAADVFERSPRDILTLPVESDPGGYVVYGQYPPEGRRVTTFECHFSRSGHYQTIYRN